MIHISYSDQFIIPLPKGHRFPMIKYELIKEQLLYQGIITQNNIFKPHLISEELILKSHCKNYWQHLKNLTLPKKDARKIGFPMNQRLIERSRNSSEGSRLVALHALENQVALNISGGYHHAYYDHGEGFCVLNDIVIVGNYLLENKLVKKILVIDLDVHQGNGTAQMCTNNDQIFTFSMHGKNNYPLKKEKSNLDIELLAGTTDKEYLAIVQQVIPQLIKQEKPDFIFYQAGVDVLYTDKLGTLSLSKYGCLTRDQIVFENAFKYDIPIAVLMGGGYSERLSDIVDAHSNTFKVAFDTFE